MKFLLFAKNHNQYIGYVRFEAMNHQLMRNLISMGYRIELQEHEPKSGGKVSVTGGLDQVLEDEMENKD